MSVPCGRCIGCRIHQSKMWAVRCTHEMQMHDEACFLTLTYDNAHLPENATLVKEHLQNFLKRLRKSISPKKIRFFACGEYGANPELPNGTYQYTGKIGRPHFHVLLFGHQFPDQEIYKVSKGNDNYYTSKQLESLWPFGFSVSAKACFQTAAYISRYVTKKMNGQKAHDHYARVNTQDGTLIPILGEFSTQSLKPGIGAEWFEKYHKDVFPSDECVIDGKIYQVPTYYDVLMERKNPELLEKVKSNRITNFEELNINDFHWRRLLDKETCLQKNLLKHTREL